MPELTTIVSILMGPFCSKQPFGEKGVMECRLTGLSENEAIEGIKVYIRTCIAVESGMGVIIDDEQGNIDIKRVDRSIKKTARDDFNGKKGNTGGDSKNGDDEEPTGFNAKSKKMGRMTARAVALVGNCEYEEVVRICNSNMANRPFFTKLYEVASGRFAMPLYLNEHYMCLLGVSTLDGLRDIYITYCKGLQSKIKANNMVRDIKLKCPDDRFHNSIVEVIGEEPLFTFE